MTLHEALQQDSVTAARRLLGCTLRTPEAEVALVEVEAYGGPEDAGSHAWRGQTPRTAVMFGPPGRAYVYFVYGNHFMLNVVAHRPGEIGAVLLRAAKPISGLEAMLSNRLVPERDLLRGPGKLCQALGITREYNGLNLLDPNSPLLLMEQPPCEDLIVTRRVGLAPNRAPETEWRFIDRATAAWASDPRPKGTG